MPKFTCTYAYDVPHYQDFTVEAETKEQAQAIIDKAFLDGRFDNEVAGPAPVESDPAFTPGSGWTC